MTTRHTQSQMGPTLFTSTNSRASLKNSSGSMRPFASDRVSECALSPLPQLRGAPFIAFYAMSGIFARRREPLFLCPLQIRHFDRSVAKWRNLYFYHSQQQIFPKRKLSFGLYVHTA